MHHLKLEEKDSLETLHPFDLDMQTYLVILVCLVIEFFINYRKLQSTRFKIKRLIKK